MTNPPLTMSDRPASLIAILFAAVAAALTLWASNPYPGTTVDSGEYLAVADGLAGGQGLSMPYVSYDEAFRVLGPGERVDMTQFPPLYPATLAALHEVTGLGLLGSAVLLGAACFFFSVVLACRFVWENARDLKLVVLVGALMLSSQLVVLHSMVWSEGPMILGLVGALYLSQRVVRTGSGRAVIGAVLFAVVASLARYVGISVALAIAIALVGLRLRAALLAIASLLPIAAWFVRNAIVSGAASEKTLVWHPPSGKSLVQGAQAIGSWVVPGGIPAGIAGAVAIFTLLVWGMRRVTASKDALPSALRTCLIFGSCYLGVVVLARTVLDQNIPFDTRILAPLQVIVIIAVCVALGSRLPEKRGALLLALAALIAAGAVSRGLWAASEFSRLPVAGYTGEEWRRSETLAFAGDLTDSVAIITNTPDPIWIWHRRASHFLPPRSSLYSGEANENYSRQLQELRAATSCDEAVVVFFDRPTRKPARSIDPVIVEEMELELKKDLADGAIYDVTPVGCDN